MIATVDQVAAATAATDSISTDGPAAASALAAEDNHKQQARAAEAEAEAKAVVASSTSSAATNAANALPAPPPPAASSQETSGDQSKTHKEQQQQEQRSGSGISTVSNSSSSTNSSSQGRLTTSIGKFKEKRPGPLNLNSSLNQEIPLDLSVKSAGNVPSGGGSIFNLQLGANQMTTLETPRIAWHENEALLLKQQRLYSSTSTNASQKARLSLAGDSPPITPSTPFLDLMSPIVRSANLFADSPNSFQDSNSSLQSFMSAQLQYNKQQQQKLNDNSLSTTMLSPTTTTTTTMAHINKTLTRDTHSVKTPHRSSSSDNLSALGLTSPQALKSFRYTHKLTNHHQASASPTDRGADGKKQSISPLVLKNFSNTDRFSYSGQQINSSSGSDIQAAKKSPTIGMVASTTTTDTTTSAATTSTSTSTCTTTSTTNTTSASTSTANISTDAVTAKMTTTICSGSVDEPMLVATESSAHSVPSGVSSATKNLLNIHLNSPTSTTPTIGFNQHITPTAADQYRMVNSDQNLDPLLSAVFCQQNQVAMKSPVISKPPNMSFNNPHNSNSNNNNLQVYLQYQSPTLPGGGGGGAAGSGSSSGSLLTNGIGHSFGSSGTLNTPTLISPSQFKTYLPSPTLSPLSSVFEIPSPLLMFSKHNSPFSNLTATTTTPASTTITTTANTTTLSNEQQQPVIGSSIEQEIQKSKLDSPVKVTSSSSSSSSATARETSFPFGKPTSEQKAAQQSAQSSVASSNSTSTSIATNSAARPFNRHNGSSRDVNLSQLVTSARDKVGTAMVCDDELEVEGMDIESQDSMIDELATTTATATTGDMNTIETKQNHQCMDVEQEQEKSLHNRSSTAIPKILVSDSCPIQQQNQGQHGQQTVNSHYHDKCACSDSSRKSGVKVEPFKPPTTSCNVIPQEQQRMYRDVVCKRAFSPQSGRNRANIYYNTRQENVATLMHPQLQHQHHFSSGQHLAQGGHMASSNQQCTVRGDLNYNFSQSVQHLQQLSQQAQQTGGNLSIKSQCQSVSAGELNTPRSSSIPPAMFLGGTSFTGGTSQQMASQPLGSYQDQNQQPHHHHHHQHHQLSQTMSLTGLAGGSSGGSINTLSLHNQFQGNGSSQSNDLIDQLSKPTSAGSAFALNQTVQGQQMAQFQTDEHLNQHHHQHPNHYLHHHQQQQQQEQQHQQLQLQQQHLHHPLLSQPRALSADVRALSRSESSCSSMDFCFRSSSAASGTPTKKYHCDQCAKAFTRSDMLTRHKRLHSGDRPFQCHECKQEFSRSDHLSTHMRTHTGEKPYKCKLCAYSACRKDMITRHMKVHNRSSPNPPLLASALE